MNCKMIARYVEILFKLETCHRSKYYCLRWTRLLKQQSSITVYRLPTKENKLSFSISVSSKQTEVAVSFTYFRLLFAEFRQHGDMEKIETWRHGNMET